MRKNLFIVLCFLLVFSLNSVAFAAETNASQSDSIQIVQSASSGTGFADSPHYKIMAPAIANANPVISEWYNGISRYNGGVISMISFSSASGIADKIEVTYVLQQSRNASSWTNYFSTVHSRSNAMQFSDSFSNSITPGYYYRLVTYHRTYTGSTCTSTQTATSGSLYF